MYLTKLFIKGYSGEQGFSLLSSGEQGCWLCIVAAHSVQCHACRHARLGGGLSAPTAATSFTRAGFQCSDQQRCWLHAR